MSNMPPSRPAVLTFRFTATALLGSLVMALVATFASIPAQIAVLGTLVSILGGLFLSYMDQESDREARRSEAVDRLSVPLALAAQPDLYPHYVGITGSLVALAKTGDPALREIAALKLTSMAAQVREMAEGTVVFSGEGWRAVYERILGSPDLKRYRSAAWVRSSEYWQDAPGRQSMRVNFDAAARGVLIERVVILPDALWPKEAVLPAEAIRPWVEEQHNHGLWIMLARESEVAREPDLLCDLGIYGERAVGVQDLDEQARTVRFTLRFDPTAVRLG